MCMTKPSTVIVSQIRTASRSLVRELGFLSKTIAGTEFSASAVHAIVEIGIAGSVTASDLSKSLLLDKSTVSRLVSTLIKRDEVSEQRRKADQRYKALQLTRQGNQTFTSITRYAEARVRGALQKLSLTEHTLIAEGLATYAQALGNSGAMKSLQPYTLRCGYVPGLIGRIVDMHSRYYSETAGFGAPFETRVATGLCEFTGRLGNPRTQIWFVERNGGIHGSIAIDGEDLGKNTAHLRWFIVDETLRGSGAGKRLLAEALEFCDAHNFATTDLWTFKGLAAARAMYEANGFQLVDEYEGHQWGSAVTEQKFRRLNPKNRTD